MRIIAKRDHLDDAPGWFLDFLNTAWAPADSNGKRVCNPRIDRNYASKFAEIINESLNKSDVEQVFHFTLDEQGGKFGTLKLWFDEYPLMAHGLADIWNERRDLSECGTCGALMLPAKGRTARYCSDACRVAAYRAGG